ncbi:hypothetical protein, partial [Halorubrum lacusprofundi]|uniref:hypothetical protein n=1 Tax=Halorubrum lacusprofundi TaxID=2247 RepID=UPI00197AB8A1
VSTRWNLAMQRKNELREALTDADAVIVDHEDVDEVLEYVDDDTDVFAPEGGGGLGFDLLENGEIATQVGVTGLSFYENVVSVWKEPGHGLVCEETEPGPSTELEKWEHRQKESSGDMTIDPVEKNLDPKTLRAVRTFIHGYPETLPEISTEELSEAQEAGYGIQAPLMATLSKWLDEIENANVESNNDGTGTIE